MLGPGQSSSHSTARLVLTAVTAFALGYLVFTLQRRTAGKHAVGASPNSAVSVQDSSALGVTVDELIFDLSDLKLGYTEDKALRLHRHFEHFTEVLKRNIDNPNAPHPLPPPRTQPCEPARQTPRNEDPREPSQPSQTSQPSRPAENPTSPAPTQTQPTPTPPAPAPVAIDLSGPPRKTAAPPYRIAIKLIASSKSRVEAALAALAAADYENEAEAVSVEIWILKSASGDAAAIRSAVDAAKASTKVGLRVASDSFSGAWPQLWSPSADVHDEYALVLTDDVLVSPLFYRYLTFALLKYRYPADKASIDSSIYGISLLRQDAMVVTNGSPLADSLQRSGESGARRPYAYALFSEKCQLLFPEHWNAFQTYLASKPDMELAKRHLVMPAEWIAAGGNAWQPLFVRFLYVHHWFTLYANFPSEQQLVASASSALVVKGGSLPQSRWLELPDSSAIARFDLCAETGRRGLLSRSKEDLRALLKARAVNNVIIMTTVNRAYLDFAHNWLCSLRSLNITNYVLYTVEESTARELAAEGHPVHFDAGSLNDAERTGSLDYGTVGYQKLILARTTFINELLQARVTTLVADVDAVWMKNPLEYLSKAIGDKNLLAQDDAPYNGHVICGGFMYLADTDGMRDLWSRVLKGHQEIVTRAMQTGALRSIDESEQVILTQLLQQNPGIKHGYLPPDVFPNGDIVFNRHDPAPNAFVIHNNFVIGGDQKRDRFRSRNLWWIDKSDQHCQHIPCTRKSK